MDYEDEYLRELEDIQKEIVEEYMGYAENYARSEEQGWFYSDRDDGEFPVASPPAW